MNRPTLLAALLFISLLFTSQGHAWNDTGHRLVAVIAFEQLSPKVRKRVSAILESHPRFAEDFAGRMHYTIAEADPTVRNRWLFSQAGTWPDIARGFDGEVRAKYHRSPWHYVNYPIFLSPEERAAMEGKVPANLRTDWTPDMMDETNLNIIQALKRAEHVLTSKWYSDADKAVHLCWLFHLVADSHQPEHSTALFTTQRFPRGDRGGNDIPVEGARNLHAYWDDLMGESESVAILRHESEYLQAVKGFEALGQSAALDLDVERWIQESHDLARWYVYDTPILSEVARKEGADTDLAPVTLTDAYERAARTVAERRMVQSGHRLAALLNRWFK